MGQCHHGCCCCYHYRHDVVIAVATASVSSHIVYTMKGSKQFNSFDDGKKTTTTTPINTGNDDFVNIIRVVVVVLLSIENDEERKMCGIELKRKSNESFDVCARICDMMATPAIVQSNGRDDDDNNKKPNKIVSYMCPFVAKYSRTEEENDEDSNLLTSVETTTRN